MWQDTVIGGCQLCFVPSMVPTILGSQKPALSTSVMNVVLVATIGVAQATLELWFSAATTALVSSAWAVLAVQTVRLRRFESSTQPEEANT